MKLINKDAVMAKIDRRLKALANTSTEGNKEFAATIGAQHYELMKLAQYIDTLEEEVELEYASKDAFIEKACDAYCKICDTKECGGTGECDWVGKFRKCLMR